MIPGPPKQQAYLAPDSYLASTVHTNGYHQVTSSNPTSPIMGGNMGRAWFEKSATNAFQKYKTSQKYTKQVQDGDLSLPMDKTIAS